MHLPILQLSCRLLFGKASHHPGLSASLQPRFSSLRLLAFSKYKIVIEREETCECYGHTIHKLSQRRLAADFPAPRKSDCSLSRSKVSSDWLPSYIKATRPVLEIFIMAGYIPDRPRTFIHSSHSVSCKSIFSSKAGSPQTAIYCFLFHFPLSSRFLVIQ